MRNYSAKNQRDQTCLRFFGALFAAIIVAGFTSEAIAANAGGNGHGSHFRFAWLANDPANPYDNAILGGIRDAAAKSHSTVDPFFAGFDPDTQLSQCFSALQTGQYDGLLVIAASPTGILPCVDAARNANVKVVAVDLPIGPDPTTVQPQVPGQVGACFITAPHFGQAVEDIIPRACEGLDPCDVLYVAGLFSFPFDQFGLDGVQQAVAANPSIHLVAQAEAFYDTNIARQVVSDALVAHPEINLIMASADQMALGAEQAADAANIPVVIVGAGAGTDGIAAVRAGRWFATFNALPRTEGRIATELMVKALRNRNFRPIGIDPVTESGLPDMWTQANLAQHPNFVAEW